MVYYSFRSYLKKHKIEDLTYFWIYFIIFIFVFGIFCFYMDNFYLLFVIPISCCRFILNKACLKKIFCALSISLRFSMLIRYLRPNSLLSKLLIFIFAISLIFSLIEFCFNIKINKKYLIPLPSLFSIRRTNSCLKARNSRWNSDSSESSDSSTNSLEEHYKNYLNNGDAIMWDLEWEAQIKALISQFFSLSIKEWVPVQVWNTVLPNPPSSNVRIQPIDMAPVANIVPASPNNALIVYTPPVTDIVPVANVEAGNISDGSSSSELDFIFRV